MATLTHYGVKGMKWKEHRIQPYDPIKAHKKMVGYNDLPGDGVIIKKPYNPVSAHKVVVGKNNNDNDKVVTKKKKRKKLKNVSKTTVQSGQKVMSTMRSLLDKPISSIIRRRQSELLPKLHVMKSGS